MTPLKKTYGSTHPLVALLMLMFTFASALSIQGSRRGPQEDPRHPLMRLAISGSLVPAWGTEGQVWGQRGGGSSSADLG